MPPIRFWMGTSAFARFLDNEFPLSGLRMQAEFRGRRFHQLPLREQRLLRTRVIRAIIIGVDSSDSMKFEVFERLNTGGLALNAQEIRHGINFGSLMGMLRDLARFPAFRAAIGTTQPRKRMVDEELILRFLALRDGLKSYRTPLLRVLNNFSRDNANRDEDWLDDHRDLFERTMTLIDEVMGASSFRVLDPAGVPAERVVNRALFEAQAIAFSVCDPAKARAKAAEVRRSIAELFAKESFDDSIRRATGDRTRTLRRIGMTLEAFEAVGVGIDRSPFGGVTFPTD